MCPLAEKVKMFTKSNRDIRFSSVANGEDNDNNCSEYQFSKCETKLKKYKVTNSDAYPSGECVINDESNRVNNSNNSAHSHAYFL